MTPRNVFPAPCPFCGSLNEVHVDLSDPNNRFPIIGDAALCARCERLCIYDLGPDGMTLREPTLDEQRDAAPLVVAGLRQLREIKRRAGLP